MAKFIGGVAVVHVGGFTETEMREKKDRVDDALQATKAALEEGIVPGGGVALLGSRFMANTSTTGGHIVYEACLAPFKKILTNAGYSNEEIYSIINNLGNEEYWVGYDLSTEDIVDMMEQGIIDPFKVTRTALENAASVASLILLTEAVVVDKPEEKKDNDGFGDMMSMM